MPPLFASMSAAALLVVSASLPAFAACTVPQGATLDRDDADRIGMLAEARSRGLAQSLRSGSAEDRALVAELLASPAALPADDGLVGEYRCRTIKLGGITDLTVYGWFRCAILEEGEGLSIVKRTGSQNFTGSLHAAGGGYLMVGAGHYNQDPPNAYGADPDRNIVGCLGALESGTLILEEPFPRFESVHDLIVFEPIR